MTKTIKLSDSTYELLEAYREKRETFDGAVRRLLLSEAQLKSDLRKMGEDSGGLEGGSGGSS